jgi:hypothetical protein
LRQFELVGSGSFEQSGIISDNDGPYLPGEDDCSWMIAPTGASRIYLTITKLELGGMDGNAREELRIEVCQDFECRNPVDVAGSPFDQNSDYFAQQHMCGASKIGPGYQVVFLTKL